MYIISVQDQFSSWSLRSRSRNDGIVGLISIDKEPLAMDFAGRITWVLFLCLSCTVRGQNVIKNIELSTMTSASGFKLYGTTNGARTGWAVSAAGDVNGDGIGDILVSSPEQSSYAGYTNVVFGRKTFSNVDLSSVPTSKTTGFPITGESSSQSGRSVSAVGDFNGDGLGDIIIGAPATTAGSAYLIYGRNTSIPANAPSSISMGSFTASITRGFKLIGAVYGDGVGFSVSGAGDFNNDGLDDILIGAPYADPFTKSGAGIVYVVLGSRTIGTDVQISSVTGETRLGFRVFGPASDYQAGFAVSCAGDVNGDSISDIIIGSVANSLQSVVLFGRNASIIADIDLAVMVTGRYTGFRINGIQGRGVSNAGDVNGDGTTDLIVSSPLGGVTYVIFGRSVISAGDAFTDISLSSMVTGPTTGFKIILPASEYLTLTYTVGDPGNHYISTAGDLNGDGYADIIIGAPGYSPTTPRANAGRTYIIFGRPLFTDVDVSTGTAGLSSGFHITGANLQDQVGYSVSALGDINGDGIDDIIIGAPYALMSDRRGGAYVIFGSNFVDNPTSQPSRQPTGQPSRQPIGQPTSQPSRQPSAQPTRQPVGQPTSQPSRAPTGQPSRQPSQQPSAQPSTQPRAVPSSQPSGQPSSRPSAQPIQSPSSAPTGQPTGVPSSQPTVVPSARPSVQPSSQPSGQPSTQPSAQPSMQPTIQPSNRPSSQPSSQPSCQPTLTPSSQPSTVPSVQPSSLPTAKPSAQPSVQPTTRPSIPPSTQPSSVPTSQPTGVPSSQLSASPSTQPSTQPSDQPSVQPVSIPSGQPSIQPTSVPSRQPTSQPSRQPTSQPSKQPSRQPSRQPSSQPTRQPSRQPTSKSLLEINTGEWSTAVSAGVNSDTSISNTLALVGTQEWVCGSQSSSSECVVVDIVSGKRITQFALPWESVSDVTPIDVSNRVILGGHTTDGTGTVTTHIACCEITLAELECSSRSFVNTLFVHAAYVSHLDRLIFVGNSNDYAMATLVDATLTTTASNYYYSASGMRSMVLLHAASPPNFIGSFVAGTSVSTGFVNTIVAGWIHMDSGDLSAMYLTPTNSNINILNSAELVNSMVLEPLGPDMFIAGALQLSSSSTAGTSAYLIRANSLYMQVKYGVRFMFAGTSGGRRLLRGSSTSYSTMQCMTRVNNVIFGVVNFAQAEQNNTRFSVLKINAVSGAITQQVSIYAHNQSVSCTDIISTGQGLSLACSVSQNTSFTQSILIAVDTELTFSRLPLALKRDGSIIFLAQSVSFAATRMSTAKNNLPITTTEESFVAKSNMEFPPTRRPTAAPTAKPSAQPSSAPSGQPSSRPTAAPSVSPQPTSQPSSSGPTNTYKPTVKPSVRPTYSPTVAPTLCPSVRPTLHPTNKPTIRPSLIPTTDPSVLPTLFPSLAPIPPVSTKPTRVPTIRPSLLRPTSKAPTEEPTSVDVSSSSAVNAGNGQNDTRDQIIAVTVLGAVWIIGLCLYIYYTHYPAAVKKEGDTVPHVIPSGPVSILPAPATVDMDDGDSVELSSLHSSELSYADSGEQVQRDDEYSDLISEDSIIFDDDTL